MTYDLASLKDGIDLYNQAVNEINNGRDDSARPKLEDAKQFFQLCEGTHSAAKDWLAKTIEKLGEIEES